MFIQRLDHVNIRTSDLPGTIRFYTEVLGMTCGPVPGDADTSQRAWIYSGNNMPVVHVGTQDLRALRGENEAPDDGDVYGSGTVDHVAFECTDREGLVARLEAANVTYHHNYVEAVDLHQLFIRDPNGVILELNFR